MSVGLCQGQHDDQAYRYVIVRLIHGPEGSRCLKHRHADGRLIDMADIRMRNGHVDSPGLKTRGKDCSCPGWPVYMYPLQCPFHRDNLSWQTEPPWSVIGLSNSRINDSLNAMPLMILFPPYSSFLFHGCYGTADSLFIFIQYILFQENTRTDSRK